MADSDEFVSWCKFFFVKFLYLTIFPNQPFMQMKWGFSTLLFLSLGFPVMAHPVPDLPVRAEFKFNGEVRIRVEVDPRCFVADAENEPYLVNGVYKALEKKDFAEMEKKAGELIAKSISFHFDPPVTLKPKFTYDYTTLGDKPIDKKDQTPVVLQAEWKLKIPESTRTYHIKALPAGRFSVLFINHVVGEKRDLNVLFPKETSYKLDLSLISRIRKSKRGK